VAAFQKAPPRFDHDLIVARVAAALVLDWKQVQIALACPVEAVTAATDHAAFDGLER